MATLRTITVADLIDLLEDEDPTARVIVTADYGDHHHTAQALPLRGEFDRATVTKSAYSNSGFALADADDDNKEDSNDESFLVLR